MFPRECYRMFFLFVLVVRIDIKLMKNELGVNKQERYYTNLIQWIRQC